MFRIRCVRLLSPCVNAIILETASSFVSPDYVCSPFTPTIRLSSTRVYSPCRPTLYQRPYELRVPTRARRLSITTYELSRYTTELFFEGMMYVIGVLKLKDSNCPGEVCETTGLVAKFLFEGCSGAIEARAGGIVRS